MIKISVALKGSHVHSEKMWLIQRKSWDHCWTVVLLMERKHKFDVLWEQGWPLEQTSRDDVRLFKNPLWTFSDKDISILLRVALKFIFLKRVTIKNIRIFVVLKYTCPPPPIVDNDAVIRIEGKLTMKVKFCSSIWWFKWSAKSKLIDFAIVFFAFIWILIFLSPGQVFFETDHLNIFLLAGGEHVIF